MGSSQVTAFGITMALREGQIMSEPDPVWGAAAARRWYVGGQSRRSYQIAYATLENLLDGPERYQVAPPFGFPHRCASLRFGNCLTFEVQLPDSGYLQWCREVYCNGTC